MKFDFHQGLSIFGFCIAVSITYGQGAEINLPKQRDAVVLSAQSLLVKKTEALPKGPNVVDPFIGIVPIAEPEESHQVITVASVNNAELAASLAAQINATGTLVFGDKRFLLTSQKRFKIGDVIKINFNEANYEVTLTDVTATNLTIKYKDTLYTRAVKLKK